MIETLWDFTWYSVFSKFWLFSLCFFGISISSFGVISLNATWIIRKKMQSLRKDYGKVTVSTYTHLYLGFFSSCFSSILRHYITRQQCLLFSPFELRGSVLIEKDHFSRRPPESTSLRWPIKRRSSKRSDKRPFPRPDLTLSKTGDRPDPRNTFTSGS